MAFTWNIKTMEGKDAIRTLGVCWLMGWLFGSLFGWFVHWLIGLVGGVWGLRKKAVVLEGEMDVFG